MGFWDFVAQASGVSFNGGQTSANATGAAGSGGGQVTSRSVDILNREQSDLSKTNQQAPEAMRRKLGETTFRPLSGGAPAPSAPARVLGDNEFVLPEGVDRSKGYFTTNARPDGSLVVTGYNYQDQQGVLQQVPRAQLDALKAQYAMAQVQASDYESRKYEVRNSPETTSFRETDAGFEATQSIPGRMIVERSPLVVKAGETWQEVAPGAYQKQQPLVSVGSQRDDLLASFLQGTQKRLEDIPVIGQSIQAQRFLDENFFDWAKGQGGLTRVLGDVGSTTSAFTVGLPGNAAKLAVMSTAAMERLVFNPSKAVEEIGGGASFTASTIRRQWETDPLGTAGAGIVFLGSFAVAPKILNAEAAVLRQGAGKLSDLTGLKMPVTLSAGGKPVAAQVSGTDAFALEKVVAAREMTSGVGQTGQKAAWNNQLEFYLRRLDAASRARVVADEYAQGGGTAPLSIRGSLDLRSYGAIDAAPVGRTLRVVEQSGLGSMRIDLAPLSRELARFAKQSANEESLLRSNQMSLLYGGDPSTNAVRFFKAQVENLGKTPSVARSGQGVLKGGNAFDVLATAEGQQTLVSKEFNFDLPGYRGFQAGVRQEAVLKPEGFNVKGTAELPGSVSTGQAMGVQTAKPSLLQMLQATLKEKAEVFPRVNLIGENTWVKVFGVKDMGGFKENAAAAARGQVSAQLAKESSQGLQGSLSEFTGARLQQLMQRGVKAYVRDSEADSYAPAATGSLERMTQQQVTSPRFKQGGVAGTVDMVKTIERQVSRSLQRQPQTISQRVRQEMRPQSVSEQLKQLPGEVQRISDKVLNPSIERQQVGERISNPSQETQIFVPKTKAPDVFIPRFPRTPTAQAGSPFALGKGGNDFALPSVFFGGSGRRRGKGKRPAKEKPEVDLLSKLMSTAVYGRASLRKSRKRAQEFEETGSFAFPSDEISADPEEFIRRLTR